MLYGPPGGVGSRITLQKTDAGLLPVDHEQNDFNDSLHHVFFYHVLSTAW